MENLHKLKPLVENPSGLTLASLFCAPFDPVTIQRPMKTFGSVVGLKPGVTAAPNPEFIACLLTGERSTTTLVRKQAGDQFKNLENFVRQNHQATTTTLKRLSDLMGVSTDEISSWVHGRKDGPLLPFLADVFGVLEGVPRKLMSFLVDVDVVCPCCGHDQMNDRDFFWSRAGFAVSEPEYNFVERLLNALVGAYTIHGILKSFFTPAASPPPLATVAELDRHPIGHWLNEVAIDLGASSLSDLARVLQLRRHEVNTFTHERLRKWSCGADQMPTASMEFLLAQTSDPVHLRIRLIAARTVASLIEFLTAAADDQDGLHDEVQKAVHQRICQLDENAQLALRIRGSQIGVTSENGK